MIVIKEKRNGGKTVNLICRLEQNPKALMLVLGKQEAYRLRTSFFPGEEPECISCAERIISWQHYFVHPELWGRPLLIDNVDIFLREHFRSNDIEVSINED